MRPLVERPGRDRQCERPGLHDMTQLQCSLRNRIHLAKVAGSHIQINGPENDNTVRMLGNASKGLVKGLFKTLQCAGLTSVNKCCRTIGTWTAAR
jgi:hypothetical protein